MDLGLRGKTALVTGGAGGIGIATAEVLLREGAEVVLTDLDAEHLEKAVALLPDDLPRPHTIAADLGTDAACVDLARAVAEAVGSIDVLVSGAGITGATGAFHELDDQAFVDVLTANLLSAIRVTRACLPMLREGGWGRIVYISSEDALQPYDDELPYVASKAGLRAFAKGLSRTYAGEGLLINTVSPAFVRTPMTDAMMDQRAEEEGTSFDDAVESFLEEERPTMELGRRGEPHEVAAVIAFLCSTRASFVNGADYRVDAGSVATI